MGIISKIYSNPSLRTFVMLAVIMLLIILLWNSCGTNRILKATHKQNIEAFKKELKVKENKIGELEYSVEVWKGKTGNLKNYSKDLADELERVKKSKVKIIIKTKIVYMPADSIEIDNVLDSLGGDNYALNWEYANEDSSRILAGSSMFSAFVDKPTLSLNIKPGQTIITNDKLSLSLVVGVKTNKKTGFDEIFITPKTPGVTIAEIEGAILGKRKKKKIHLGIGGGYGIGLGPNSTLRMTPHIGIYIIKPLLSF